MAWLSFACICLVGTAIMGYGLTSDERALRIDKISFILGTVFGVWTSIVLAYFGAAAATDMKEITKASPPGK